MYGHTHKPDIDYSDDIITINPGSLSYPRQAGRLPSYIVMEIDRNGEANFVLKYVQQKMKKTYKKVLTFP